MNSDRLLLRLAEEALMRRKLGFMLASTVAAVVLLSLPRTSSAQEETNDSVAMQANRGLKIGVGPTLLFPLHDNGPYGGGLTLDGRYGIQAGATVLSPGGRLSGYIISNRLVGMAMPTFRITLPVGPLAPFILGGVGVGGLTNDSETGVALLGGGGMMIHIARIFAFGAEASYEVITGTELKTLTIGPAIAIGGG
jgi:hypothetical protein